MDLSTGNVTTIERVKSFKVAEDSGAFVAYLLETPLKKPDEKKEEAKKEEPKPEAKPEAKPETGKEAPKTDEPKKPEKEEKKKSPARIWSSVSGPQARKPASPISSIISGTSRGRAWPTAHPPKNRKTTVSFSSTRRPARSWPCSGAWATIKIWPSTKRAASWHSRATGTTTPRKNQLPSSFIGGRPEGQRLPRFAPASAKSFPAGMAVSENGRVQFSRDGGRVFFGISETPQAGAQGRS